MNKITLTKNVGEPNEEVFSDEVTKIEIPVSDAPEGDNLKGHSVTVAFGENGKATVIIAGQHIHSIKDDVSDMLIIAGCSNPNDIAVRNAFIDSLTGELKGEYLKDLLEGILE